MEIKDLTPNPKNPRTITDKKLKMLKKSIEEFGDLSGFVFNKNTNRLVGGHQRAKIFDPKTKIIIEKKYESPTKTGTIAEGFAEYEGERFLYREVQWDENKEKAANIAANKGAGEWDLSELSNWMQELDSIKFDLDLTMFDQEERDAFFPEKIEEGLTDPDEVPDVPMEPKTKLGDIYQLGNHRLMCGDSTSIDAVEKLMNGEKADMVFTDPPYGINEETDRAFANPTRKAKGNTFPKILGDDSIDTALSAFSLANQLSKVVCYWGGNYYAHKIPPTPCWIVWDKRIDENQRDMNSDCELAYVKHPSKKSIRIFRHLWKGMIKGSENGQGRIHPTQKPIALAEWSFEELAPESKIILDLFGGSGSTLIACEKTNRKCFMMEIDPHYCDVIVSRWEKFTGKKATLLDSANNSV